MVRGAFGASTWTRASSRPASRSLSAHPPTAMAVSVSGCCRSSMVSNLLDGLRLGSLEVSWSDFVFVRGKSEKIRDRRSENAASDFPRVLRLLFVYKIFLNILSRAHKMLKKSDRLK